MNQTRQDLDPKYPSSDDTSSVSSATSFFVFDVFIFLCWKALIPL